MIYTTKYESQIGNIIIASNGKEINGIYFDNQKNVSCYINEYVIKDDLPIFCETKKWLDIYFSGECPNFTPPLNLDNISEFRKRICEIMLNIPFGKTTTYGSIAKQIEKETKKRVSAQAVGGAVGHNPISIIIPCHRVVGSNGNLTGYAGGIDKKIELLKVEGIDVSKFTLPK